LLIPLKTRGHCDGTFIYPYRAVPRLMAKGYYNCNRALNPAEQLLKLTAIGFLCCGNPVLHSKVESIYYEYKDFHKVTAQQIMQVAHDEGKFKDWRYKLGVIHELDMIHFPSYERVIEFFSFSEDKTNRLYKSAYRADRSYYPGSDFMVIDRNEPHEVSQDLMASATAQVNEIMRRAMANDGFIDRYED